MRSNFVSRDTSDRRLAGAGWVYWRPRIEGISELGILHGSHRDLATHFHEEVQITFVLAGRRSILMRGEVMDLTVGECACIPAGVSHRSLAGSPDLVSLNAYLPAGDYAFASMRLDFERLWPMVQRFRWIELSAIFLAHRKDANRVSVDRRLPIGPDCRKSVSELAAQMGRSREGFSRMFAKRYGMPPHAFRLTSWLNRAKELLRAGEAVAAVAADTEFADQSHLGRCFQRAFGVTPGRYRVG